VQKNGGWFGFISEALEVVLKVMVASSISGGQAAVTEPTLGELNVSE